jgi:adenylate kinase family enzyme
MSEALLLTGLFGTGKSTVAADIAEMLSESAVLHAALDLDWLTWTNAVTAREGEHRMMLSNLALVADNYRRVGVQRFILARTILDLEEVTTLRQVLDMPLRVVELTVPFDEIERRLTGDPTEARRDDLEMARAWLAERAATGFADLAVANDRTVRAVSVTIAEWMCWAL